MSVLLAGISHRTAPVDLREQLLLGLRVPSAAEATYRDLLREYVILSTCNRVEVYAEVSGNGHAGSDVLAERDVLDVWLESLCGAGFPDIRRYLYRKEGAAAVRHLMRVASGLDSQVLGEPQVLGQVSQALAEARSAGTVGPVLYYVFSRAVHAGKRARTETKISWGSTSISRAAVALLEREFGDVSTLEVLVVGAGETAELAIQALRKHGNSGITCINRSATRAQVVASRHGCRTLPWRDLVQALTEADAVITATGAPHPVIYAQDVAPAVAQRAGRRLVFMDIAVPRDVDPLVRALPGVVLFDIDQLEATLDFNRALRASAVPQVERIVEEETESTMKWLQGREVTPLIESLRRRGELVADAEIREALRKLGAADPEIQKIVTRMGRRIVNKILHQPTVKLKAWAARGDLAFEAHMVADLFGLDADWESKPGSLNPASEER